MCVHLLLYTAGAARFSDFLEMVLEIIQSLSIKYFCAIVCSKPPVSYLVTIMCVFVCFSTDNCIFVCEQRIGF